MREIKIILIVFLLVIFSSCATLETQQKSYHNYSEKEQTFIQSKSDCILSTPHVYSGTIYAFELMLFPVMCPCSGESGLAALAFYPLLLPIFIINVPLSAVADTIILPYTVYKQIKYGNIENGCEY